MTGPAAPEPSLGPPSLGFGALVVVAVLLGAEVETVVAPELEEPGVAEADAVPVVVVAAVAAAVAALPYAFCV
jgi:hypothetical protein